MYMRSVKILFGVCKNFQVDINMTPIMTENVPQAHSNEHLSANNNTPVKACNTCID